MPTPYPGAPNLILAVGFIGSAQMERKGRDYMDDGNDVTLIGCYCELILFGNFKRKKKNFKVVAYVYATTIPTWPR
jgi:hypothetical protein